MHIRTSFYAAHILGIKHRSAIFLCKECGTTHKTFFMLRLIQVFDLLLTQCQLFPPQPFQKSKEIAPFTAASKSFRNDFYLYFTFFPFLAAVEMREKSCWIRWICAVFSRIFPTWNRYKRSNPTFISQNIRLSGKLWDKLFHPMTSVWRGEIS